MAKVRILGKGTYDGEEGIIVRVGAREYIVYTDDEDFAVSWAINQYNIDEEEDWDDFAEETDQGFY